MVVAMMPITEILFESQMYERSRDYTLTGKGVTGKVNSAFKEHPLI